MVDYTKETGRNELCPCNSGKKFKNCCGNPVRAINPIIVNKLMAAMVLTLKSKVAVPCSLLDTMPPDVALQIQYCGKDETYYLQLAKIETEQKQKLIVPKRELIVP
jgi:hypothetical protein